MGRAGIISLDVAGEGERLFIENCYASIRGQGTNFTLI